MIPNIQKYVQISVFLIFFTVGIKVNRIEIITSHQIIFSEITANYFSKHEFC